MLSLRRDPGAVGLSPLVVALVGAVGAAALPRPARAQQAQNPSPLVEHTRPHPRLAEARPPGRREELALGSLFVPQRLAPKPGERKTLPLLIVFHGGAWVPDVVGDAVGAVVVGVQITAGSSGYAAAVADPGRLPSLAGWSAGCGAIRELLRHPDAVSRIDRVLAIDWLLGVLGLKRRPVARWGPMGTVVLSDTRTGRLRVQGFAGNSAPDHIDLLHATSDLLRTRE